MKRLILTSWILLFLTTAAIAFQPLGPFVRRTGDTMTGDLSVEGVVSAEAFFGRFYGSLESGATTSNYANLAGNASSAAYSILAGTASSAAYSAISGQSSISAYSGLSGLATAAGVAEYAGLAGVSSSCSGAADLNVLRAGDTITGVTTFEDNLLTSDIYPANIFLEQDHAVYFDYPANNCAVYSVAGTPGLGIEGNEVYIDAGQFIVYCPTLVNAQITVEASDTAPGDVPFLIAGTVNDGSQFYTSSRLEFDSADLNMLGPVGKYPRLTPRSDAYLGDGFMLQEGVLAISDGVPSWLGTGLAFLHEADFSSMGIAPEWDWDGMGNNRFSFDHGANFGDDVSINGELAFNGDLNMGMGAAINLNGGAEISESWDGSSTDIDIWSRDATSHIFGGNGTWSIIGRRLTYIDCLDDGLTNAIFYVRGTSALDSKISLTNSGISFFATPQVESFYIHGTAAQQLTNTCSGAEGGDTVNCTGHGLNVGDCVRLVNDWTEYEYHTVATVPGVDSFTITDTLNRVITDQLGYYDSDLLKIVGGDYTNNPVKFRVDRGGNVDVRGNVLISGELEGNRYILTGGRQGTFSSSNYLIMGIGGTLAYSATMGNVMMRPGSITGLSAALNALAVTTAGTVEVQVRVNDIVVLTQVVSLSAVAVYPTWETQARGIDNFNAGDIIQMYWDFKTFAGSISGNEMVEYVYNN